MTAHRPAEPERGRAAAAADHGRRLLLGAGVAGAAQDRLLPAPDQRAAPRRDPRGRDQGGAQGPGAGRRRHRLRRRAAPRQRHRLLAGPDPRRRDPAPGQDLLLRLLRRGRHARRCRDAGRRRARAWAWPTDFAFTREQTDRPVKFSFTGPFSLSRRIAQRAPTPTRPTWCGPSPGGSTRRRGRWPRPAPTVLQIDEPFLAGYPEQVELAIEAVNIVTEGVDATWAPARLLRQPLRPAALGGPLRLPVPRRPRRAHRPARARVRPQGRRRPAAVPAVRVGSRALGLGVIDVKTADVEPPDLVAARIRRALDVRRRPSG